jgi:hypothetical protein
MKIVSSFKDYYDFAAGYDTDPRKVFVRQKQITNYNTFKEQSDEKGWVASIINQHTSLTQNYYKGLVIFCNNFYDYFYDANTNIYYTQYQSIPAAVVEDFNSYKNSYSKLKVFFFNSIDIEQHKRTAWGDHRQVFENASKIIGAPILYTQINKDFTEEYIINGCLNDIKFGAIKLPHEAYQELYNWIEFKEPETDTSPENMSRFESKGFDKKTSFRKIK